MNKIKANTLIVTVIISLVLAMSCSMLILLAYYNFSWAAVVKTEDRLHRNVSSAVNLVLADTTVVLAKSEELMDLFGQGDDSVDVKKENWGLFTIGCITASANKRHKSIFFLYGSTLGKYFDGCMYVADHKRPVSLVGDVQLTGNVYLSQAGLKAGHINQQGYSHPKLLKGTIERSGESLPALNQDMIHHLLSLTEMTRGKTYFDSKQGRISTDTMKQSFAGDLIIKAQRGRFTLSHGRMEGHIMLISDSVIEAGAGVNMENIILVAPVIRFNKGFSGTVQAIATDSIVVGENVTLHYPSAVVLLKSKESADQKKILIKKYSRVAGVILSYADGADKIRTYVEMEGGVMMNGIMYVNGFMNIHGTVYGTVLNDFFIYKTPATVYENYLVDARINREKLSGFFISSPVFGSNQNKVISWVQ